MGHLDQQEAEERARRLAEHNARAVRVADLALNQIYRMLSPAPLGGGLRRHKTWEEAAKEAAEVAKTALLEAGLGVWT